MNLTKGEWRNIRRGLIFTAPWILGLLLFVVYPIGASLYYSFTDFNVLLPAVPVGFTNYTDLLKDDLFYKSFRNTMVFTFLALPLSLALALFIAIFLNEGIKGRGVFRTIYFIPSLVPLVPLGILWQWIFNSQYGVLNVFLEQVLDPLGMSVPNWLGDPFWTKPALVITRMWVVGGAIIIFLAALQDVPRQYYESAELDGASSFHKFRHITLPLISPAIYFNLIIGMIACIQIFALPYVMTGRGPADSTYFFTMYIYDNAFRYLKMGYASAMAWIMFVLILLLTILATRLTSRFVFYGGERS